MVTVPSRLCQMLSKLAVGDWCCLQAGICTGLIQCNRVKACEHSDIRKDRRIIFTMAVAVRADILYQCNMEMGTSVTDSLCILCHLAIKKLVCTAIRIVYGIIAAGPDTAATAFAFIVIDNCFLVYICNRITSALFRTTAATTTDIFMDGRLSAGMLLHFSGTASASHTDILQSTAKAGCLMSLEMAETDKNICVHDSMSDQGSFAVFSVYYRNFYFIGSSNSVTDDDLASGCDRVKSVKICTVQMLQCVLSASRIKGITICQERHSALLLTEICYYLCIVRTKECHISKLSEMHLDGYEFSIHIDIFDSCGNAEFFQFVQLAGSHRTTKISEINC